MGTMMHLPKLRFPGFEGKWDIFTLLESNIKLIDGDRGTNYPNGTDFVVDGYCLFMSAKNVTNKGFSFDDKIFISKEKDEQLNNGKLERDDIVITTRGSIGHIAYYDHSIPFDNLRINSGMLILRNKSSNLSTEYFYKYLDSDQIQKELIKISFGSAQPQLTVSGISKLKVAFPTKSEQTKIASFLNALEEKLATYKKKKNFLEHYKKGVMQQLFSQELRFKDEDGNDFPDWEELDGNLLFDSVSDKKHNSDLPILAITQEFGAIPRELIDYNVTVTDKSVESYKVVQIGDFIISLRSFQGGIEYSNYKGICSPAYIILRPITEIDDRFYKFYFKTEFYIKQLNRNLEGIRDGKMISFKYFSEISLPYPSLPEQQKIASFLSALDAKIAQTALQIEKMQLWKKGLLQQMFV